MSIVEERIKLKTQKKFSKQVQAEKKKDKAKQKKQHLEEISDFRKKKKIQRFR